MQHQRRHESPQVGPVATALLNIPVMATALAACYLALWLAQPEVSPKPGATASPAAIAVVEPCEVVESMNPVR